MPDGIDKRGTRILLHRRFRGLDENTLPGSSPQGAVVVAKHLRTDRTSHAPAEIASTKDHNWRRKAHSRLCSLNIVVGILFFGIIHLWQAPIPSSVIGGSFRHHSWLDGALQLQGSAFETLVADHRDQEAASKEECYAESTEQI